MGPTNQLQCKESRLPHVLQEDTARSALTDFQAGILPPEDDHDDAGVSMAMPTVAFRPAIGGDYTASYDAHMEDLLRKQPPGKPTIWAQCMPLPGRQRLVFRDTWIGKRLTLNPADRKHRQFMQLYRKGSAQLRECQRCSRGAGPFRKCVVDRDGSALNGACTNCAFREKATDCDHHFRNRKSRQKNTQSTESANRALQHAQISNFPHVSSQNSPASSQEIVAFVAKGAVDDGRKGASHPKARPSRRRVRDDAPNDRPRSAATRSLRRGSPVVIVERSGQKTAGISRHKRQKRRAAQPAAEGGDAVLLVDQIVLADDRFEAGEATAEQVRFLLSRCPAPVRGFLEGAWISWTMMPGEPEDKGFHSMEEFLSKGWHETLNRLIPRLCEGGEK